MQEPHFNSMPLTDSSLMTRISIGRPTCQSHLYVTLVHLSMGVFRAQDDPPECQDNQVILLRGLNSPVSHFSNRSYPCIHVIPRRDRCRNGATVGRTLTT